MPLCQFAKISKGTHTGDCADCGDLETPLHFLAACPALSIERNAWLEAWRPLVANTPSIESLQSAESWTSPEVLTLLLGEPATLASEGGESNAHTSCMGPLLIRAKSLAAMWGKRCQLYRNSSATAVQVPASAPPLSTMPSGVEAVSPPGRTLSG